MFFHKGCSTIGFVYKLVFVLSPKGKVGGTRKTQQIFSSGKLHIKSSLQKNNQLKRPSRHSKTIFTGWFASVQRMWNKKSRVKGEHTSSLPNLVCLMLSIVSECHQFTVIKLIRSAALIRVPKIDQHKTSLVYVNCLGKHQRIVPPASSHEALRPHQLPSWKLMREFLAGCVGLVFSYYSLAFSTFLLQVERTVYSILGTEMWALAGWRFDSCEYELLTWIWREFTSLVFCRVRALRRSTPAM